MLVINTGMVTSKVGKRHALTGFEALKEMFISRSVLLFALSILLLAVLSLLVQSLVYPWGVFGIAIADRNNSFLLKIS